MAEQPFSATQPAAKRSGRTAVPIGLQQCPNCDVVTPVGASVCQECGEDLTRRPRRIRCRNCSSTASSALVLCPHCGRELHAAPPRLLTWGAPALLALLFLALLTARWQTAAPLAWLQGQGDQLSAFAAELGEGLETATGVDEAARIAPIASVGDMDGAENRTAVDGASQDSSGSSLAVALAPTATPVPSAGLTATPAPSATPTTEPTATLSPTATATATPTATATATAKPSATPTARSTSTSASTPTESASATLAARETRQQGFALPTATPTTGRSDDLTSERSDDLQSGGVGGAVETTYVVQPGDTLLGIARDYEVDVQVLMVANSISAAAVYSIRPGDELTIPAPDGTTAVRPTPTSTPTVAPPTATATEAPATATPEPAVTYRLDTPLLRSPEDGAMVSCNGAGVLAWEQVPSTLSTDRYILHLGFVNAQDENGQEQIVWVLRQPTPPDRTAWNMDNDLCALAPQALGRRWQWYVEVVDEASNPVSEPSEVWSFTWN